VTTTGGWTATRAVALGVVGGYVDTVGYMMLRGLFPNHVTGNLPIAAAHPGWRVVPVLAMVPLWFVAVVVAAVGAGRVERRRPAGVLPAVLGAEAALIALFLALGVALVPHPQASTLVTQAVVAGAGVCAMATQSVVTRLGGYAYPTTMVTGTLTLLGMDAAQVLFRLAPRSARPALVRQVKALTRVVAAFAAGAALAGVLTPRLGFWALVAPLATVAACARQESMVAAPASHRNEAVVLA
jgi:uncharacterized membrane protein YoaK (UPF0700 family)